MANANDTGLLILAGIAALGLAFRPRGAGVAVGGTGSRPRSPKTAARLQPAAPALDDPAVLAGGRRRKPLNWDQLPSRPTLIGQVPRNPRCPPWFLLPLTPSPTRSIYSPGSTI